MIDIKFLRENPDIVKENIKKKFQNQKLVLVDEVIDFDTKKRAATLKGDELRSKRNSLSSEIGNLMRNGKKDEAEKIKYLINKLPDQQRQVMMMKHWDEYSDEEIEQVTGLSAGNIRVILSRARKTIREQYIKIGQR